MNAWKAVENPESTAFCLPPSTRLQVVENKAVLGPTKPSFGSVVENRHAIARQPIKLVQIQWRFFTAVSIARGRFLRQWADADRRIIVAKAADQLLARWFSDSVPNIPFPASGSLEGLPGYDWQTTPVDDPASKQLGSITIRLQVFDHRPVNSSASRLTDPVLSLDVLVHKPEPVGRPAR